MDQGTQLKSALFAALAHLLGSERIYTTPYHERFHRSLKATLICSPGTPWPDILPMVLLGLRNAFKEHLQASPAEILFGCNLRTPGDFVQGDVPVEPPLFVSRLRGLMREIRPVSASRQSNARPFVHKELSTCSHVFKRVEFIRKPLNSPYTGPHELVKKIDGKTFLMRFRGMEKTVSTDGLHQPAFLEAAKPPTYRSSLEKPSPRPSPSTAATPLSTPPRAPVSYRSSP